MYLFLWSSFPQFLYIYHFIALLLQISSIISILIVKRRFIIRLHQISSITSFLIVKRFHSSFTSDLFNNKYSDSKTIHQQTLLLCLTHNCLQNDNKLIEIIQFGLIYRSFHLLSKP